MSAAFTPGPWKFRLEAVRTVIYHEAGIGEKAIAVGAGSYPDHIANARLIAAAPELYAVVEEWLAVGNDMKARKAIRERARAALAKARGEAA